MVDDAFIYRLSMLKLDKTLLLVYKSTVWKFHVLCLCSTKHSEVNNLKFRNKSCSQGPSLQDIREVAQFTVHAKRHIPAYFLSDSEHRVSRISDSAS